MKVLVIGNQKGGVGKTTTAVTLASGLAREGRRVLLVDLDAQGNVADALGLEKCGGLYELLFGSMGRAVRGSKREWLSVVLSDHSTVEAKGRLVGMSFRERVLAAKLTNLANAADPGYAVCVIDTAPGVDVLQVGAMVAADWFLVPVSLEHLAVVGAGDLLGSVQSLQQVGEFRGRFLGLLPTLWDRRSRESAGQLKALVEGYGRLVWPPIPVDARAREAPRMGQVLWEYDARCRALMGAVVKGEDGQSVRLGGYGAVLARLRREVGL